MHVLIYPSDTGIDFNSQGPTSNCKLRYITRYCYSCSKCSFWSHKDSAQPTALASRQEAVRCLGVSEWRFDVKLAGQ